MVINMDKLIDIFTLQKSDFYNEKMSINKRVEFLKVLKANIIKFEDEIYTALKQELGKSPHESYSTELSLIYNEINYFIKNLKKIEKPEKIHNKFPFWFSSLNKVCHEPYGVVLIMSPFNYPFQLLFVPLIGAIASGNRIFVKISPLSSKTDLVIKKIISSTFSKNIVFYVDNTSENISNLFNLNFDFIFFTGSTKFGKIISSRFAERLTPMVLELGGKCPVIIDNDIDLVLTIKRLLWGKLLNAGQTCIAADYVIVNSNIYNKFILEIIKQLKIHYPNYLSNEKFGKIIDVNNFKRLMTLITNQKIIYGGNHKVESLKIEPTIIEVENSNNILMQEEIFGPILPIIKYDNSNDVISIINDNPNPLAIYIFSSNNKFIDYVYNKTQSGSFVVNDVLFQITKPLPFGGIKSSGMGTYHFKYSYECFTYKRPYVKTSNVSHELRFNPEKVALKKLKKLF